MREGEPTAHGADDDSAEATRAGLDGMTQGLGRLPHWSSSRLLAPEKGNFVNIRDGSRRINCASQFYLCQMIQCGVWFGISEALLDLNLDASDKSRPFQVMVQDRVPSSALVLGYLLIRAHHQYFASTPLTTRQ